MYKAGDNYNGMVLEQGQADRLNSQLAQMPAAASTSATDAAHEASQTGNAQPAAPQMSSLEKEIGADAYKQYQDRLAGIGVSDVQKGIIDSQNTQQKEMAAATTPEAKQAVYEKNLAARKQALYDSLSTNKNVSKEYLDLFQKKWDPKVGEMVGVTDEEWNKVPDYKRDPAKEAEFLKKNGITVNGGTETAQALKANYDPATLAKMVETGQVNATSFSGQDLKDLGLTPERLQALVKTGYLRQEQIDQMQNTAAEGAQAESVMNATPKPTNNMMSVLSEALNAKNNFKNQQLGASDLFKQAGLSGYSVLAQSLNQRSQEMDQKYKSATALIAESGGQMASTYKTIAENYKNIRDAYDKQLERLSKIDEQAKDHEAAMDLALQKAKLDKDAYAWQKSIDAKYQEDTKSLVKDEDGNPIGYFNTKTGEFVPYNKTKDVVIDDKVANKSVLDDIFNIGKWGGQCGTWASTKSTAKKVGNTWAEKSKAIEANSQAVTNGDYILKAGDKVVMPLGVRNDNADPGHVILVLSYDPATGKGTYADSNRKLDEKVRLGDFDINDWNNKYGNRWGAVKGTLKDSVINAIDSQDGFIGALGQGFKGFMSQEGPVTNKLLTGATDFGIDLARQGIENAVNQSEAENKIPSVDRYKQITGTIPTKAKIKELKKLDAESPEFRSNYFNKLQEDIKTKAAKADLSKVKTTTDLAFQKNLAAFNAAVSSGKSPKELYDKIAKSNPGYADKILKAAGYNPSQL